MKSEHPNNGGSDSPEWHALAGQEVVEELDSRESGLSDEEAERRLEAYGPNRLPSKKRPSIARVFLRQFLSPFIYILIAAAILATAIGEVKDSIFITAVLVLNAVLGTIQEWKAEKSAAELQDLLKISSRVIRGGTRRTILAEQLVPGDIILLQHGGKVPADARLLLENNLSVDESLLTGESVPSSKQTEAVEDETALSDRSDMVFAGTVVTEGRGRAVVVETGTRTETGKIAEEVSEEESENTPLVIRMKKFTRQVSYIALGIATVIAMVSIFKGTQWDEAMLLTVALLVSAIPEGLPIGVTVALSIGTSRMADRNVIVRKLSAVESLGSCTCIASDKTGTLTMNQQTADLIELPDSSDFKVTGEGYSGEGVVTTDDEGQLDPAQERRLEDLARIAIVVNEAELYREDGEWKHSGNVMDVALLALGYRAGLSPQSIRNETEVLGEIPFESDRRYAASVYRDDSQVMVGVKGAPEVLVGLSDSMMTGKGKVALDEELIRKRAKALSGQGYRLIAIASGRMREEPEGRLREEDIGPLTFLGIVGMKDPLRPEVEESVRKCQRAGVEVVMITGDHPETALAIARQAGIAGSQDQVTTGSDMEKLESEPDSEMVERVNATMVFARIAPMQKVDIVEALIEGGNFVAVTGDGVNDAPALRRANIGVAMGSGTDVAKDTAQIIITDDDFSSIESGIEEGRFAYDNIRKVIYLLISTGFAEVILFLLAIVFGLPVALVAVQLLWLNLVTNGIQDVALAFEAGERGAMLRPPRDPDEGVFDSLMVQQVMVSGLTMGLIAFVAWWWLMRAGWSVEAARNMLLLLMVLLENVHVFNCRSERESAFKVPLRNNFLLIMGVIAAQGIHIASMYIPFMEDVLGTAPVTFTEWITLLGLALILLVVMESFKLVKKWLSKR